MFWLWLIVCIKHEAYLAVSTLRVKPIFLLNFQISALSYNGYPGSVSNKSPQWMEVSALTKAICLRFSEGHDFIAFSTHFPNLNEVKNLAQVRIRKAKVLRVTPSSCDSNFMRKYHFFNGTIFL